MCFSHAVFISWLLCVLDHVQMFDFMVAAIPESSYKRDDHLSKRAYDM